MVLKRQTVWLLTMLSLIIVLSVYYITAEPSDQLAFIGDDTEENDNVDGQKDDDSFIEIEEITEDELESLLEEKGFTNDEVFNSIRLERQETRDRLSVDYTAVIASGEASAEVQSRALDSIENLRVLAQQEEMLETLIKAKGYDDVLVIADAEGVKIIVKADELSKEEGVKIMNMAKEKLNMENIAVNFQPKK
jgi:stage III sporulation protein AH